MSTSDKKRKFVEEDEPVVEMDDICFVSKKDFISGNDIKYNNENDKKTHDLVKEYSNSLMTSLHSINYNALIDSTDSDDNSTSGKNITSDVEMKDPIPETEVIQEVIEKSNDTFELWEKTDFVTEVKKLVSNPYLPIIKIFSKDDAVTTLRVSIDCRPFIPNKEGNNKAINLNFYDKKTYENPDIKPDPNIKPIYLLKKMMKGNDLRPSFFWYELFKLSCKYEINQMMEQKLNIKHAFANICFVCHSFLYMMIELNFNSKLIKSDPLSSPDEKNKIDEERDRDSNQGEKLASLIFGIDKQVGEGNTAYKISRINFNKYFEMANKDNNIKYYELFNQYFGNMLSIDEYSKSSDTEENKLKSIVKMWWDKIITKWKNDVEKPPKDVKNKSSTQKMSKSQNKPISEAKKEGLRMTAKRLRWERLFKKNLDAVVNNGMLKQLKLSISHLLPKMIEKTGGADASDILLFCKEKDESGELIDSNLSISIKNVDKGAVRLGTRGSSRYFMLHMSLAMPVIKFIQNKGSASPTLSKLKDLLPFLSKDGKTKLTLEEGVKCGELGGRNLIMFSHIMRELYIHFYQEFAFFNAIFKKLFKTTLHVNFFNTLGDDIKTYLGDEKSFNYWKVHQISIELTKEIKEPHVVNAYNEICEIFSYRAITGINNEEVKKDIELKKQLAGSILKNILAESSAMQIISFLSHKVPKEADISVMNKYNDDDKYFHTHTVDFLQLLRFIIYHELIGDDRENNKGNSIVFAVAEEEAIVLSSRIKSKLPTFIWKYGYASKSMSLPVDILSISEKDATEEVTKIRAIIKEESIDENANKLLTIADLMNVTVSQYKPKFGISVFPMSSNEETTALYLRYPNRELYRYYYTSCNKNYRLLYRSHEKDLLYYQIEGNDIIQLILQKYDETKKTNAKPSNLERSLSYNNKSACKLPFLTDLQNYYKIYFKFEMGVPRPTLKAIQAAPAKKQKGTQAKTSNIDPIMVAWEEFDKILTDFTKAIVPDYENRIIISKSLIYLFEQSIIDGTYRKEFKLEAIENASKFFGNINVMDRSKENPPKPPIKRLASDIEKNFLLGGGKINTGIKKKFDGKIKNIYKIKGSNSYYIIYNKKLISVKQYKKELLLNKSKPSHVKPLVDKSNISKYNLRVEQYKNKNLSDYFINKLKTHISDNDGKNNIYKIGIKKIKVILKDIYKINK